MHSHPDTDTPLAAALAAATEGKVKRAAAASGMTPSRLRTLGRNGTVAPWLETTIAQALGTDRHALFPERNQ